MTLNKALLIAAVLCFILAFILPLLGAGVAFNLVALGLACGFGSMLT